LTKLVNLVYICAVIITAMKTLSIPQPNLSSLFKRTTDHTAVPQNKVSSSTAQGNNKPAMTASQYIITALGEGFKQNFLGADINMEFLTLTVRSYATTTVKALRKLVVKPVGKTTNINTTPTSI
jgi:hypothetical protein